MSQLWRTRLRALAVALAPRNRVPALPVPVPHTRNTNCPWKADQ